MDRLLPLTFEALRDALVPEVALDQRSVVRALSALTRAVMARAPTAPMRVIDALALADRWLDGQASPDEITAFHATLQEDALSGRRPDSEQAEILEAMALGTLSVARWEDHADWPEEVVEPAMALLELSGAAPADAARDVAATLAKHGLLG